MHNDCPLVPDKIEIKGKNAEYQQKIADLYNIPISNFFYKKVPNFFDKETYVLHYQNLQLYLRRFF